jgi:hypothetical protein
MDMGTVERTLQKRTLQKRMQGAETMEEKSVWRGNQRETTEEKF